MPLTTLYFWLFFFLTPLISTIGLPPILTCAPYLTYSLLHYPLKSTLWRSILCGLVYDFFQSSTPFGSVGLCLLISALVLYKKREFFFNDKFFSLPLFTFWFSFLFTLLQILYLRFLDHGLVFKVSTLVIELILMPACDALYALLIFYLPLFLFEYLKKPSSIKV